MKVNIFGDEEIRGLHRQGFMWVIHMTIQGPNMLAGHEIQRKMGFKIFYDYEGNRIPLRKLILKKLRFYIRKEKQFGLDTETRI